MENTILCQHARGADQPSFGASSRPSAPVDGPLLVLIGPTGVGKTAVAVHLASQIAGEIVNADSMQVYQSMDIGTAKPGPEDRARVPFHLIDMVSPDQQISVARWKRAAEEAIAQIRARCRVPIVCGGTGLYVRALLNDWNLAGTAADPALRAKLQARAAALGGPAIHAELARVDSVSAERLHPNDVVRVVRALEVYYVTGTPIAELQARDCTRASRRHARQFGLTLARTELYSRIEKRVDEMIDVGLEAEVRRLLAAGFSPEAGPLRSLGYKEMVQYIHGELSFTEAVNAMKQSTRRYAKRQQTWFHADSEIEWIDVSALDSATVASQIASRLDGCAKDPV